MKHISHYIGGIVKGGSIGVKCIRVTIGFSEVPGVAGVRLVPLGVGVGVGDRGCVVVDVGRGLAGRGIHGCEVAEKGGEGWDAGY